MQTHIYVFMLIKFGWVHVENEQVFTCFKYSNIYVTLYILTFFCKYIGMEQFLCECHHFVRVCSRDNAVVRNEIT